MPELVHLEKVRDLGQFFAHHGYCHPEKHHLLTGLLELGMTHPQNVWWQKCIQKPEFEASLFLSHEFSQDNGENTGQW